MSCDNYVLAFGAFGFLGALIATGATSAFGALGAFGVTGFSTLTLGCLTGFAGTAGITGAIGATSATGTLSAGLLLVTTGVATGVATGSSLTGLVTPKNFFKYDIIIISLILYLYPNIIVRKNILNNNMYDGNLTLKELMDFPLPPINRQKKLEFKPSLVQAHHIYMLLNENVFNNELKTPTLIIKPRCRQHWGMCYGEFEPYANGSYCEIKLMDKWFCIQWFITIMAHEMAHQYQWDIYSREREKLGKPLIMSHGPSFFKFRDALAQHNIPLKTSHSQKAWFKHQNLLKC